MGKAQIVAMIVVAACGLAALGAVFVWAPPCDGMLELANGNMVPMKCHYAAAIGALLGLVLTVTAVACLVVRKPLGAAGVVALMCISFALFLVTFATPLSVGVCAADDMTCHATAFWLRGCGLVAAISAIASAVANPDRKRVL